MGGGERELHPSIVDRLVVNVNDAGDDCGSPLLEICGDGGEQLRLCRAEDVSEGEENMGDQLIGALARE